jgi:hypothetical protein
MLEMQWLIKMIPEHKKEIVKNLYLSGIAEEFIAMQLDFRDSSRNQHFEGTWSL